MKKNLFIAAIGLLVMAGCSSNGDEIDNIIANNENAISFDTYVGKVTKATDKSSFVETDAFGVFAFYTGASNYTQADHSPNFMYETIITRGASGWTYSPLKYWPNTTGEKITFLGYYPSDKEGMTFYNTGTTDAYTSGSKGFPDIKFVAKSTAEAQIDFMYASELNKEKTGDGKISFNFGHALSKVNIKAKMKEALIDGTTVSIKSVTLNNIYTTNTLKYTGTPTPKWVWDAAATVPVNYTSTLSDIELTKDNTTEAIEITSGATGFLMTPQTLSTESTKEASITIVYDVTTADGKLTGSVSTIENTVSKDISALTAWEMNKQYIYTIEISLQGVSVDAQIANWDNTPVNN